MQSKEENKTMNQIEADQNKKESNDKKNSEGNLKSINYIKGNTNNQQMLNVNKDREDNQLKENISEGDDLMNKLNEEADKIDTQVNKDNLKMMTKYANLTERELQSLIKEKK